MNEITEILDGFDPNVGIVENNLWIMQVFEWIREPYSSAQLKKQHRGDPDFKVAQVCVARLRLLLDAIESRPELQQKIAVWWNHLIEDMDMSTFLADFGFSTRNAFFNEFAERLRFKYLPMTPKTNDLGELFTLCVSPEKDKEWLNLLYPALIQRLAGIFNFPITNIANSWDNIILDAITYCSSQICAIGFSAELRQRIDPALAQSRPFHRLNDAIQVFQAHATLPERNHATMVRLAQDISNQLTNCQQAVESIYSHLDENGISVGLVFRMRQIHKRIARLRILLEAQVLLYEKVSPEELLQKQLALSLRLMSEFVVIAEQRTSLRKLFSQNSSLLVSKLVDRSAETGEHYFTRNTNEFGRMFWQAAGGGFLTAFTVLTKFLIGGLGLLAFWNGWWAGVNYALSFVLIQLLHCTLATKQPATTAPALAEKLKDVETEDKLNGFVDEVSHLFRSQMVAAFGNVLLVFPTMLCICFVYQYFLGVELLDNHHANDVIDALSILSPTLLFAAFTGVLLFLSSLCAGWVENWYVLQRFDSAFRHNPKFTRALGAARSHRWADFLKHNIGGLAGNISLGLMLGLVPVVMAFFGLGLEVRHVTLSAGQLGAAMYTLGVDYLYSPIVWWSIAAIPLIGMFNLLVSFYLAFRLTLRSHDIRIERALVRKAIWTRLKTHPLSFFLPVKKRR